MADRYTILQHCTNTFYLVDCPILLVSHALTKDKQNNNLFVQCKFENTLPKAIKALYVHINCFDVTNNTLTDVDSFSYLDIEVRQYQTFGDKTPIVLPDKETRKISITPTKIVFVDNSIWENDLSKPFELFYFNHMPISELGELAEEYRRELAAICLQSNRHEFLPTHKDGYTICGCGKILVDAEKACPACGVNLKKLFLLYDVDKLRAGLEKYKKEKAEREEQERQAAIDKEVLHYQKCKRRKNIIKKVIRAGGIILLVVLVCLSVISYQNYSRRQEEQKQLNGILEQIEESCIENGNTCSYSVDENIIRIIISDLGLDLSIIPEDLTQTSFTFWTDFESATDSWDTFVDKCELLKNQILTLLEQDEIGASYSTNIVMNSDDGQKMLEFDNGELTFNYWDRLTSYYNQNIKIWMDALENLN
ncbi:hypothetical protein [Agathobaculum sp. Marseille-P7918]|uniref:hypothetical protein n=1 Tax=Agathobaculum sp. Marseille-P7918 TaxID=2479843 RepID=UPI000F643B7E|nr:hypothetical protein [Agathobaculum sp. Marseille-P7918]